MSGAGWRPTALALLAGLFNGSYPLFLKTAAVLAADVHAIVFQSFKSTTLLLLGAVLVCSRLLSGTEGYTFTWWGVAGAAAWIPSGLATISAVPRIGMGPAMLTAAGTGTAISFFVGWLALGESLKLHTTASGGAYVLAPVYLAGILVGMAGLVFAPHALSPARMPLRGSPVDERDITPVLHARHERSDRQEYATQLEARGVPPLSPGSAAALRGVSLVAGYALAASSGAFSSVQYLVVSLAQRHLPPDDPALDPLGSWTLSFAMGAVLWTSLAAAVFALRNRCAPVPAWRRRAILRAVGVPGVGAGLFWCAGNLLSTLAVERGGNAVTVATYQAANLITSGAWGLMWYKEFRGTAAAAWTVAAAFTLVMVLLLALEKGHS